jgi:hypothetical protein
MKVKSYVAGEDIEEKRIAAATSELLRDIRVDADPQARLVTRELEPGDRGDAIGLGEIARKGRSRSGDGRARRSGPESMGNPREPTLPVSSDLNHQRRVHGETRHE